MAGYPSKPPKGYVVNRGDPLARGLASAWLFNEKSGLSAYDSAGANVGVINAGAVWSNGPYGSEILSAGGTTERILLYQTAVGLPSTALAPFTVAYLHRTSSLVSLSSPFGFGTDPAETANGDIRAMLCFLGDYYWFGASADWDTGIAYDADNLPHFVAVTFDGVNLSFYRDGVLRAGPVTTGVSSYITPGGSLWANYRHPAGSDPNGSIIAGYVYKNALSATNISLLTADPFRMFRPSWVPVPLKATAASGFNPGRAYRATSGVLGTGVY